MPVPTVLRTCKITENSKHQILSVVSTVVRKVSIIIQILENAKLLVAVTVKSSTKPAKVSIRVLLAKLQPVRTSFVMTVAATELTGKEARRRRNPTVISTVAVTLSARLHIRPIMQRLVSSSKHPVTTAESKTARNTSAVTEKFRFRAVLTVAQVTTN